ncbi:hypothetical protein AB838_12860 [Rhodobacteraceae bacterium (ex Bugula neritina AB1)]|nr:hypothetical protein AB838_12860 [Rhodobacteraceae bacterium (ex Bugula neritina AB1)]
MLVWASSDGDGTGIWGQRYDAAGTEVGPIFQINTTTAGGQNDPEVITVEDGSLVVVWQSGSMLYGQRLNADGSLAGSEFEISASAYSGGQRADQQIAAFPDGGFVVTWVEHGSDGSNLGVLARRYNADGSEAGEAFVVNTYTGNPQDEPSVTALSNGGFVVSWSSGRGVWGYDSYGEIFAQAYDADGNRVGGEFHVNTTTEGGQGRSQVLAQADGSYVILWQNSSGVSLQAYAADGTVLGGETNLQMGVPGTLNTVIALDGGGYAVLWNGPKAPDGTIPTYVQSFDATGTALTALETIETGNTRGFVSDLDQLENGTLLMTWEGPGGAIYTQVLDAPPASVPGDGPVEQVPTVIVAYDPSTAALQDGGRMLVWASSDGDGTGIWGQRYDAAGTEVGPIFQINTTTTDYQTSPEAITLEDGSVLVTWVTGSSLTNGRGELYAQRVDADGKFGDEIAINPNSTASYSKTADITALEDGGYAIVWYEYHGSSSNRSVYLQQFEADGTPVIHTDAAGTPLTGPVRVPDPAYYNQTDPEILALNGGGYVVTWTATKGFSQGVVLSDSAGGIYGQMFNGNGAPAGSEFHVNTTTADDQEHSRMVALENGGFMVLWKHDGSPDQLRFQKFYSDGTPSGGEGTLATGAAMTDMGAEWQAIGLSDGGVAVAWHKSNGDLYVQSFDEAGNALTDVVTIETSNGANFISDLDQLSSGQLVVTWEEGGGIFSQTLSAPPPVQDTTLSSGDDLFLGISAGESILGLEGADTIDGGGDDDRIDGGSGDDVLTGGSGADTFVFSALSGTDTITDFETGADLIEISSAGLQEGTGFSDLMLTDLGTDLQISFADPTVDTAIILTGLSSSDFSEADVIFV